MINFNSIPHSFTAAVGALCLSSAFIVAAVGPAHVAATPVQTAQVTISAQAHA